jgi:hypothetical protein
MSSGTVKLTWAFEESVRHLCQILTKFGFRQRIFVKISQYQISRKSVHWEPP